MMIQPGSVRRHPDWPQQPYLAMRTLYKEGQYPGWTPWIRVSPGGSEFVTEADVADWVDVVITDEP